MRKFLMNILCLAIIFFGAFYIYSYLDQNNVISTLLEYFNRKHTILTNNNYNMSTENKLVEITDDFNPDSKQDLLNIYYTVFSSGMNDFTFFCAKDYTNCTDDVQNITEDNLLLSHINNFVHPFNSYKSVKTIYTSGGKVTIEVKKLYTDERVKEIRDKVNELYPTIVLSNKDVIDNIKSVHDYIINHTRYDSAYINNTSSYESNNAYGPLFEGYAICSGYTDLMAIFLDKMGIPNHKISNEKHVWNFVYLNGQWLHLDLTWDDPVATNGRDYLKYDYFLITTDELKKLDKKEGKTEHVFDETIYAH